MRLRAQWRQASRSSFKLGSRSQNGRDPSRGLTGPLGRDGPEVGAIGPVVAIHRLRPVPSNREHPIAMPDEEVGKDTGSPPSPRRETGIVFEHDERAEFGDGLLPAAEHRPFETLDVDLDQIQPLELSFGNNRIEPPRIYLNRRLLRRSLPANDMTTAGASIFGRRTKEIDRSVGVRHRI